MRILPLLLAVLAPTILQANEQGRIRIRLDRSTMTEKIIIGTDRLSGVYCTGVVSGDTLRSCDYPKARIHRTPDQITIRYSGLPGKADLLHTFRPVQGRGFFFVQTVIVGDKRIASNHIAPFCFDRPQCAFIQGASARSVEVPFDNDHFVHYRSVPAPSSGRSYEASAFFEGLSRKGLIVGSVEHTRWKTGIDYTTGKSGISRLYCFGGVADRQTRDQHPHGFLSGTEVSSPELMVGIFSDWRQGLETLGDEIARRETPRKWSRGFPVGWNSWAAMERHVNYPGVLSVSDFFASELTSAGFTGEGPVFIGLDSFWDRLNEKELREFVRHCHSNGQEAGIYWCPFSDWLSSPDREVEGSNGKWHYRDIYLRSGGRPLKIESLAVDPTHEGTRMRMKHYISYFKELGFTYLKFDFINNGALEADSYYDPSVTTGIQAYNEGMDYLCRLCGDDMFIALSIAPVFPSRYGNARRISCDTWGAMSERDWGSTGYMLNSLSFGWWLDKVYPYNDPDHILLFKPDEMADFGPGANRARMTSAVITGTVMLGDNLSDKGEIPGDPLARQKVLRYAAGSGVLSLAGKCGSFRPLEGWTARDSNKAEPVYVGDYGDTTAVAIFNFDAEKPLTGEILFNRLDLNDGVRSYREFWSGHVSQSGSASFRYEVAPQDAEIFLLPKGICTDKTDSSLQKNE